MGKPEPCPDSASCWNRYGSELSPSRIASRFFPNSSMISRSGAPSAKHRAISINEAGEGPVRRGSVAVASSSAAMSNSPARNLPVGGISPYVRRTAVCSARSRV